MEQPTTYVITLVPGTDLPWIVTLQFKQREVTREGWRPRCWFYQCLCYEVLFIIWIRVLDICLGIKWQ